MWLFSTSIDKMDGKDYFTALLAKYANGTASHAETAELMQELSRDADDEEWQLILRDYFEEAPADENYDPRRFEPMIRRIVQSEAFKHTPVKRINRTRWFAYAAAAIVIIISGVAYLWNTQDVRRETSDAREETLLKADVPPGGNRAVLTLADGKEIVLDSATNGVLFHDADATVEKTADGKLAYQKRVFGDDREPGTAQHTLTTPRGGQYQLTLPDGTKVWLNALSSIIYPAVFEATERIVMITGEVFFEVAKNKEQPFIVQAPGGLIKVLGTQFNVNAYEEEGSTKISLVEGSVLVNDKTLKPGQALVGDKIVTTDIDRDIAWKNGTFVLDNTDLPTIMRQVMRWYDIEVRYEGKPGNMTFGGVISRNLPLSEILDLLKNSGVQFRLEGKTLYVNP